MISQHIQVHIYFSFPVAISKLFLFHNFRIFLNRNFNSLRKESFKLNGLLWC
jgi:hypothetical protein